MLLVIFYWLVNISILGCIAGGIVLLLRKIRILPRTGIYGLWILSFLRLWLPVGLASPYSLLSVLSKYVSKTIVVWKLPSFSTVTASNFIQAASQYSPLEFKNDVLADIFKISSLIWLIVAIASILTAFILYISTKSVLRDAKLIKDNIYQSDKLLSPAVYGLIKPRIILPVDIAERDLQYILTHEKIHINRFDNQWRILAIITACVHWFNPLVWVSLKYFLIDMELACDEAVLRIVGEKNKKEYAEVLLLRASSKSYFASSFAGAKTRLRIENILTYKKLTLISGLCFATFFIVIAITVLTNAVG